MAKLLNPKRTERFEPPGQERVPEENRVAFHLAVPTVEGRAAYLRAVAKAGGRSWSAPQQLACLRQGIEVLLGAADPETAARGVAQVDDYLDWMRGYHEQLMAGELTGEENVEAFRAAQAEMAQLDAALNPITDVVAQGYEPYANMRADIAAYPLISGIVAARLFLTGWENIGVTFERNSNGATDAALECLSDLHFISIGAKLQEMLQPTEAKNPAGPPEDSTATDSSVASPSS